MNSERGQALPLALLALAAGMLLIVPFANHIGGNLLASRIYGQVMNEQYSCDAGVEHAIWNLTNGGLASQLPDPGDSTTYQLDGTVNGVAPTITVTAMAPSGNGSYIYALQGNAKKSFWKYDITGDTWTSMADTPDKVKAGGALTYNESYIYALQGDAKKSFWKYDITGDTWTSMADTPDNVAAGGALTYNESYIYALQGDAKKSFWKYDITGDTWTSMADAPDNVAEGGALTCDGSYIYTLQGNAKKSFWKYDITGDTWTSMADAPGKVSGGGALAYTCASEVITNYEIVSTAGDTATHAVVSIGGETVSILSWQIE